MVTAPVSNIQRYSTKDGPGIRTTLFLSGCSLNCAWCSNPELIPFQVQVLQFRARCRRCGECIRKDPSIKMEEDGAAAERSSIKDQLVGLCPHDAFEYSAKETDSQSALETLLRDRVFYESSGGGVTLSGGEALLHKDFVLDVLKQLREEGIHTCVDTCGNVPLQTLIDTEPYTSLYLYDIKAVDPDLHRKCTGRDNTRILENFAWLNSVNKPMWVRMPLIHGWNDEEADFRKRLQLVKDRVNIERVDVLCYHDYGAGKYKALGIDYRIQDGHISDAQAKRIKEIAEEEQVPIHLIRD